MPQPAARVGDMHVCPMVTPGTPPIPHVGGAILPPGGVTTLIGGVPSARATDMCMCMERSLGVCVSYCVLLCMDCIVMSLPPLCVAVSSSFII